MCYCHAGNQDRPRQVDLHMGLLMQSHVLCTGPPGHALSLTATVCCLAASQYPEPTDRSNVQCCQACMYLNIDHSRAVQRRQKKTNCYIVIRVIHLDKTVLFNNRSRQFSQHSNSLNVAILCNTCSFERTLQLDKDECLGQSPACMHTNACVVCARALVKICGCLCACANTPSRAPGCTLDVQ